MSRTPQNWVKPRALYDIEAVTRFWRALSQLDLLFKQFSGELRRGAGAVRLWPHHFDLAMMWLTGRLIPGQDPDNEDYADERMNFGFSTGDATVPEPYLYATAYPLPPEMPHARVARRRAVADGRLAGRRAALRRSRRRG